MKSSQPTIQNLSNRAIFQVTGNDAIRYINGQVSQDVTRASSELAVYSIVASFKGKVQGDFYLRIYDGDLLIDTSESQRESLLMRLDKYLIADDAEIQDVTEQYQLYHVIDDVIDDLTTNCLSSWNCNRYGVDGKDYLCEKAYLHDADSDLAWEKYRIAQQIPNWDNELSLDILPPEANLEERAISYTKGCYTGQEVISRMKSAGKTNRHLVGFTFNNEISLPLDLYTEPNTREGKAQATITSVSKNGDNNYIGLGYRTRKSESISTFYDTEGNTYSVS